MAPDDEDPARSDAKGASRPGKWRRRLVIGLVAVGLLAIGGVAALLVIGERLHLGAELIGPSGRTTGGGVHAWDRGRGRTVRALAAARR